MTLALCVEDMISYGCFKLNQWRSFTEEGSMCCSMYAERAKKDYLMGGTCYARRL